MHTGGPCWTIKLLCAFSWGVRTISSWRFVMNCVTWHSLGHNITLASQVRRWLRSGSRVLAYSSHWVLQEWPRATSSTRKTLTGPHWARLQIITWATSSVVLDSFLILS